MARRSLVSIPLRVNHAFSIYIFLHFYLFISFWIFVSLLCLTLQATDKFALKLSQYNPFLPPPDRDQVKQRKFSLTQFKRNKTKDEKNTYAMNK